MAPTLAELCRLPTLEVARRLIGAVLARALPEGTVLARIVETEAYLAHDPACHGVHTLPTGATIHRCTARNAAMFGPPGRAYVYFTYGNHFMLNLVTEPEGVPSAVLIRALQPLDGRDILRRYRAGVDDHALTNGPGKLTRALAIDRAFDGHDLTCVPLQLLPQPPLPDTALVATTRIGISRAVECPYRFYERGNPWVSRR